MTCTVMIIQSLYSDFPSIEISNKTGLINFPTLIIKRKKK